MLRGCYGYSRGSYSTPERPPGAAPAQNVQRDCQGSLLMQMKHLKTALEFNIKQGKVLRSLTVLGKKLFLKYVVFFGVRSAYNAAAYAVTP